MFNIKRIEALFYVGVSRRTLLFFIGYEVKTPPGQMRYKNVVICCELILVDGGVKRCGCKLILAVFQVGFSTRAVLFLWCMRLKLCAYSISEVLFTFKPIFDFYSV